MKLLPLSLFLFIVTFFSPALSLADPLPGSISSRIEEVKTKQGMTAWLLEDHSLPIVTIQLAFLKSGSAYDPAGKEGLAYLVSGLLNEGAGSYTSSAFKKALEDNGIMLSFNVDEDYFYVTVRTLSSNMAETLKLLSLALSRPRFEASPIELVKEQVNVEIAKKQESPTQIADETWRKIVFPAHGYGRNKEGTSSSVSSLTQKDLFHYTVTHFTQKNSVISVVGDINSTQLSALLESYFTFLPADAYSIPALKPFTMPLEGHTVIVQKAIPQAVILFGGKGIGRDDPDFYAAYVLNHILGGKGLDSRLMKNIRINHGLAYSVSSYLDTFPEGGVFKGMLATKNARATQAVSLLTTEMERLRQEGITEKELSDAKNNIMLSFPVELDTTITLAQFITSMQLKNLGIDYLSKRNAYINAVTLEDVNRIAKILLDPKKMTIVIVGNQKEMKYEQTKP